MLNLMKNYLHIIQPCTHEEFQKAVDFSIQNNKTLFLSPGIYELTPNDAGAPIRLDRLTADGQSFNMSAVPGTVVIREKAGQTALYGRWCKMFYFYTGAKGSVFPFKVSGIRIENIIFDKQASRNEKPSTRYSWEQAHIFSIAGGGSASIHEVIFKHCRFRDKAGGGINIPSTTGFTIDKVLVEDCDFEPLLADIGERGDLELTVNNGIVYINRVKANYAQIEPSLTSSSKYKRLTHITDSYINTIEYTETSSDPKTYHDLDTTLLMDRVICKKKFLPRGIFLHADHCDLKVHEDEFWSPKKADLTNCTIRLHFIPEKSESFLGANDSMVSRIIPFRLMPTRNAVINNLPISAHFNNCQFVIDSKDQNVSPTGFAIKANTGVAYLSSIDLTGCEFDSRLEGSVDAYGGGVWRLKGNKYHGSKAALKVGGFGENFTRLDSVADDFTGAIRAVIWYGGNDLWSASIDGRMNVQHFTQSTKYVSYPIADRVSLLPRLYGSSVPNVGYWLSGTKVWNTDIETAVQGWLCISSGSPGVWKEY